MHRARSSLTRLIRSARSAAVIPSMRPAAGSSQNFLYRWTVRIIVIIMASPRVKSELLVQMDGENNSNNQGV